MKSISVKLRVGIYIVTFIAAAAITYIVTFGRTQGAQENPSALGEALLPVVYMTTESGINYNYLHGYTCEVEQNLIHDAITPIASDRRLEISVKPYGSAVSGISYELRSVDGKDLIERTTVSDYSGSNGVIRAEFKFRNLLESNTEYMLKIDVGTEKTGTASYYTRLIIMDDANTDSKLSYIRNFSEYTLDEENLGNITAKLETDATGDNTNLGRVNIHSKLSQVGFAGLKPTQTGERYITLNEINGKTASMTVKYKVSTTDATGSFDYNIKEFFRINQPDDTVTYVYNYDRWMEQIFAPEKAVSSTGELYLGICSDTDVEMKYGASGKVTCFVRENALWRYSLTDNEFVRIFSFGADGGDGLREEYDEHAVKILDIDKDGNVRFLVYGYMNRGLHEGQVGISVFGYNAKENRTEEIIFIPRTDPYVSIAQDIETLAYINESNILYMYNNGSIYYLDCTTKECMVVAGGVISSTCSMSEKSAMLVYQTGEAAYDCLKIYILHLDTGELYELDAEAGSRIKVLGFIDGNAVYGEAKGSMIKTDGDGNVSFPMYGITLMDKEHKTVREYGVQGAYVTEVIFDDGKLEIKRVREDGAGNLVEMEDDRLISNIDSDSKSLQINIRTTELRQKESYISLVSVGTSAKYSYKSVRYEFPSDSVVHIVNSAPKDDKKYYAYGFGSLHTVSDSLASAISAASPRGGVVVDGSSRVIWERYKPQSNTISSIADSTLTAAENTQAAATDMLLAVLGINKSSAELYGRGLSTMACLEAAGAEVINLTGGGIEEALYFVGKGLPVIAKTDAHKYELVYGYSGNNVSTVDFTSGTSKSYTKTEFDNIISVYGSVLITAES
ncbi:MAG: hypothetical protein NC223_10900 [Butyrivibrio sp.]|nr:hypothetical protein [Butyrivibrio sp.]